MAIIKLSRLAVVAGLGVLMQAANAQASFTLINASYSLNSSGPFNFTTIPDGANMKIDFLSGVPAFKVGDGTGFGSGVATIVYTVTSQVPIFGIDMIVQGDVELWGEVNWTETAEIGSTNLGSISGSIRGSAYGGGSDGAFTQIRRLNFNQGVTSFKVKKTFDMDIAGQTLPSQSLALVGLVEQNLVPVPEPTTMIGLALGASALIARRRRNK